MFKFVFSRVMQTPKGLWQLKERFRKGVINFQIFYLKKKILS